MCLGRGDRPLTSPLLPELNEFASLQYNAAGFYSASLSEDLRMPGRRRCINQIDGNSSGMVSSRPENLQSGPAVDWRQGLKIGAGALCLKIF
jgi:hypothetical protein